MTICNNTPNEEQATKHIPGSQTAARVAGFYDSIRSNAGVLSSAQEIELQLQKDYGVLTTAAAHIPTMSNYNQVSNMLAKSLGWKSLLHHAPNLGMTEAGAARYTLQDRARVASNMIETLALYRALPKIRQLASEYKAALPDLPAAQLQELMYDHVTIGQFPELYQKFTNPEVSRQLTQRYSQHLQKLQELGVDVPIRQKMDQLAGAISGSLDELRQVAANNGLDIQTMQNGGYFPLQANEEIERILNKVGESANLKGKSGVKPGIDAAQDIRQARRTNVPIVVDLDKAAQGLGMETGELSDMLSQPGAFSKHLYENSTAEEIQKYMQDGFLAQVPALSDELTEIYKSNLELPIQNLAEALILDPEQAVRKYASDLAQGVKNSSMAKTILNEGMDAGWVTHELEAKGNPNFVRLGSSDFLKDYLPSSGNDGLSQAAANDLWIHKTVAEQAQALFSLNRSWADQGVLGRAFQNFTSLYKKSTILQSGLGFVQRMFMRHAVGLYAATGDLSHLSVGLADVTRLMANGTFDSLDNTAKFATVGGQDYTLRQLFIASLVKRGTHSLSGAELNYSKLKAGAFFEQLRPEALRQFYANAKMYNDKFGNPATGQILTHAQLLKQIVGGTFDGLYSGLAFMTSVTDYSARWAAIRSLSTNGLRKFKDLDELLRYTDDYFNLHEDVGSVGKMYSAVGQPFAGFAIAAPGAALRFTLQHPYRAANMAMLYSHFTNQSQLTDAELLQWQKDKTMVSVYTDPTSGKQYGITPGTEDFYKETQDWLAKDGGAVARAFGIPAGSIQEQVEQQQNPMKPLQDFLTESASKTYLGNVLLPALGLDPKTFEKELQPEAQDTLLGVPIQRQLRNVLVGAFPLLRTADEKLPTNIVGQKQDENASTLKVIKPGQPGWLGFVPSSGGTKDKAFEPSLADSQQAISWFLSKGAGLSLSEIDPGKNLISNYNSFAKSETDIGKTIDTIGVRLGDEQLNQPQRAALYEQQKQLLRLSFFLKYQQYLINNLAETRGLPTPQATEMVLKLRNAALAPSKIAPAYEFLQQQGLIPAVQGMDKYNTSQSNRGSLNDGTSSN